MGSTEYPYTLGRRALVNKSDGMSTEDVVFWASARATMAIIVSTDVTIMVVFYEDWWVLGRASVKFRQE
jgi:hypothetical protein